MGSKGNYLGVCYSDWH
uniref:Uncharacterized protein n=1 Tax=Arundo donax TaxID=35708 RepID=A0A0A9CBW5_ARUDO